MTAAALFTKQCVLAVLLLFSFCSVVAPTQRCSTRCVRAAVTVFIHNCTAPSRQEAEISDRSPRKLFIFTIWKKKFWIQVLKKNILFNFEKGGSGCVYPVNDSHLYASDVQFSAGANQCISRRMVTVAQLYRCTLLFAGPLDRACGYGQQWFCLYNTIKHL